MADWGAAHQFRLIWVVQMIGETCTDPADNNTCTEEMKLVHIYDDEYILAGLNVQEEHGTSVAIMYEDPATDADRGAEDSLWQIAYNLGSTFLRGRDCDSIVNNACQSNGQRDVRIDNMATFASTYDEANQPITTEVFNYEHSGFVAHVMMTETRKVLNDHFCPMLHRTTPLFCLPKSKTPGA